MTLEKLEICGKDVTKAWKELNRDIVVNKRELVLGVAACTLAGMLLGIFLSPRKNKTVGSYNGNHNTGRVTPLPDGDKEPEEEEA